MGILYSIANSLMMEKNRRPFEGKILQLGKQDIYLKWEQLIQLATQAGTDLKLLSEKEIETNQKPWCRLEAYVSDTTFFKALGFDEVKSMDYSGYEGSDYIRDLNELVPEEYYNSFDVIYDGGTAEHIFHMPNFLTNICLMLKPNGRIIHDTPTSGIIDHGFYSVSPTLFYDFYTANGFEISKLCVNKYYRQQMQTHLFEETDYIPGDYDYHKCFLPDNKICGTFCIATKINAFTSIKIPQQSIWSRSGG